MKKHILPLLLTVLSLSLGLSAQAAGADKEICFTLTLKNADVDAVQFINRGYASLGCVSVSGNANDVCKYGGSQGTHLELFTLLQKNPLTVGVSCAAGTDEVYQVGIYKNGGITTEAFKLEKSDLKTLTIR